MRLAAAAPALAVTPAAAAAAAVVGECWTVVGSEHSDVVWYGKGMAWCGRTGIQLVWC